MKLRRLFISLTVGMAMIAITLLTIMTIAPVYADDTDYYVSASAGSDVTGDGSMGNPWQTIGYAVNSVAAATDGHPDNIIVLPGLYDVSNNGETFPITMTNANIHLVGGMPGEVIIDGEGATAVISTTAQGLEINGFTISNTATAIQVEAGGVDIRYNIFEGVGFGVNLYISDTVNGGTFDWSDIAIISNTFTVTDTAINFDLTLNGANSAADITFGDTDILSNTFNLVASANGLDWDIYDVSHLDDGSLTIGDVTIAANNFYSGSEGIYFNADFTYFTSTVVTGGSVYINDNILQNQSDDAVYMYFYSNGYWYTDTTGIYGDVVMHDNTVINATRDGLHLEGHSYNQYFYDNASVVLGDVYIQNNTVEAGDDGIEYWEFYAYYLYNNASVLVGDTFIQNNTVNADDNGIHGGAYEFGDHLYNAATATMGNTYITSNTVTGTNGLHPYYYYVGYYAEGDSVITIGDLHIRNNDINATSGDGIYEYYEYVAYEADGNAQLLMGDHFITDNNISGSGDGIYIEYYEYYVGSYSDGNSYAEMPSFEITNNTIEVDREGVYFYSYSNPDDSYGNAMIDLGGFLIDNNTFISGSYGVDIYIEDICEDCYDSSGAIVQDIIITNNDFYTMTGDAVYLYIDEVGYAFDDDGTVQMGDTIVANNVMNNIGDDGIYVWYNPLGYYTSTVTMGALNIIGNQINDTTDNGIYIDYEANTENNSTIIAGQVTVQNNVIDSCGGDGIYADIAVYAGISTTIMLSDTQISQNTVLHCDDAGIQLENVENNTVWLTNNIMESRTYGLDINSNSDVFVDHNTIIKPINPTVGSGVYVVTGTVSLMNNIILANQSIGLWNVGGTVSEDYTLFARTLTDTLGSVSSMGNSITTSTPGFVDPMSGDYHLLATSPAVDSGTNIGILVDRDGAARPQGIGFDIGAYEFAYRIYLPVILKN